MKQKIALVIFNICVIGSLLKTNIRAESLKLPLTADTYIDTDVVDRNHANDPDLILGLVINPCSITYIWSTTPVYCKNFGAQIYIEIDTLSIENHGILPTDITSASVYLFKFNQIETDSKRIDIYTAPSKWDYTSITWANSPAVGTIITHGLFTSAMGWQHIDITPWLKNVLAGSIQNNGVVIRTYDSNEQASMYFSSRCLTAFPNLGCHIGEQPYLNIEYTPNLPPSTPSLIDPPNNFETLEKSIFFSSGKSLDPEGKSVSYTLEIATDENFSQLTTSQRQSTTQWTIELGKAGTYFWRVAAMDAPFTKTGITYSETRRLTFVQEEIDTEENDKKEDIDEGEAPIDTSHNEKNGNTSGSGTNDEDDEPYDEECFVAEEWDTFEDTSDESENVNHDDNKSRPSSISILYSNSTSTEISAVQGVSIQNTKRGTCVIEFYTDTKRWNVKYCDIPAPVLSSVKNSGPAGSFPHSIETEGSVPKKMTMKIEYYRCKDKSLWDWKSWFNCVYEKYSSEEKTVSVSNTLLLSIEKSDLKLISTKFSISQNGFFKILSYSDNPLSGKKISATTTQHAELKIKNKWIDVYATSPKSNSIKVPSAPPANPNQFSFPFDHIIGVTQWHGFTAYQSPHTGIDFGATEEPIISPSDGTYIASGYDTYYGSCLSGGYYLLLLHNNGKYSAYFHLKSDKKPDGKAWTANEAVKKGQPIALSGNSGSWNCQPLAYHLHYEIRNERSQLSHVNPVPITAIDWNLVPTLGWQQNPGRLSGDNPHPSF